MSEEIIKTNIEDLVIYKNNIFGDKRGTLFQLAPSIDSNDHFPQGIKNIIAVDVCDNKMRGGHYHKQGTDEVFILKGTALWVCIDLREKSKSFKEIYSCIITQSETVNSIYDDLLTYNVKKQGWLPHLHIPSGVYHCVWSIGQESLIFVEAKNLEFDESDYIRIETNEIAELSNFKEKYNLL